MGIVELDPIIRIKLILFLVIYLMLMSVFRYFMRSYLKVEKTEVFFRKYINSQHQKIDRILTGIFIALMVGSYLYETRILNGEGWFITTGTILLSSTAVTEIVRAYMQWKYSDNSKEYMLTLSQLVFAFVLLGMAFTSHLFGLFRF